MRIKRMLTMAVVVLGATVSLPVITAQVASAHDIWDSIDLCGVANSEPCGSGGVTNSHTRVHSCDSFTDGADFRTQYKMHSGITSFIDDLDSGPPGCKTIAPGTLANPIVSFRVIWKATGGWVYGPWQTT